MNVGLPFVLFFDRSSHSDILPKISTAMEGIEYQSIT